MHRHIFFHYKLSISNDHTVGTLPLLRTSAEAYIFHYKLGGSVKGIFSSLTNMVVTLKMTHIKKHTAQIINHNFEKRYTQYYASHLFQYRFNCPWTNEYKGMIPIFIILQNQHDVWQLLWWIRQLHFTPLHRDQCAQFPMLTNCMQMLTWSKIIILITICTASYCLVYYKMADNSKITF